MWEQEYLKLMPSGGGCDKLLQMKERNTFVSTCRFCYHMRLFLIISAVLLLLFLAQILLPRWMQKTAKTNDNFKVLWAKSYLRNNDYFIDARLQMKFTPVVLEALKNGVPLIVRIELQLLQKDFLSSNVVKQSSLLFELRYHALTDIYSLKNLASGQEYSFNSQNKAMEQLGAIRAAHLINKMNLDTSKQHWLKLRVLLDIWKLPDVLRPVASLSPQWQLQSAWYQWELK